MRRWWPTAVVLAAAAFAFAYPMQVNALEPERALRARARARAGTPTIDKSRTEIGDLGTGDVTLVGGHYYSNKAPGLAFVTLPAFVVVEATGMRTTGDPTKVIWALHLWAIALPALLLVALVRYVGDRLEPGYGLAAAATLAFGTLVLPFATLYFEHVLAASLRVRRVRAARPRAPRAAAAPGSSRSRACSAGSPRRPSTPRASRPS